MPNTIKILPKHLIQQLNTYFKDDKRSSIEKLLWLVYTITARKASSLEQMGSLSHFNINPKDYPKMPWLDTNTLEELITIYDNNPESLLLYFASNGDPYWVRIAVPVNDKLDLVTSIATTTDYIAWQGTYLYHENSDMTFDLTYIDAYQGDDTEHDDDKVRFVKSYLYGNPYSEDWTESKRTDFADVYDVVDNNRDE